ncbi:iron chelate uptake ABC transporter family permease subunit [Neogemmobacter tilapiae]|uniref:Ferric enterobactin transporter FepG n=1 Tax=Neogemmobacter tilapiae TaxID=875041 RepID=A0A918WKP9_9RHOB|nr:iron chelate uptake ABC transporter family permease subunit [Gemmobacter tilapiae]GHC60294.1 ferric enterobactin transporter FepG [Gemmobacter tilapiae]
MKGFSTLILLLALIAFLSLLLGEVRLSLADLWQGLTTGEGPGALTLRVLRGPRVATAMAAGAAFGLSGAVFQMLLRNPLAAPDVMGFNAGAGLAVILALAFGLMLPMALIAALGGLLAALLVGLISWQPGRSEPALVMILVGLGIGFTASGLATFFLLTLTDAEASEARRWIIGSLAARSWNHAAQITVIAGVLGLLLAVQLRALACLELGPVLAQGLGLSVEAAKRKLLATAVLLAAGAVAVAGPVPFVALMAGPLGIGLTGARQPAARLLAAAGAGALILTGADLLSRSLWQGVQLPVGVMTGLLGAPWLMWLLTRAFGKVES